MKKVMIDSGHFKSNLNKGQTGYYEHEGVWKISNYLKQILESNGVQVDFTKLYEEDLDLYKRGQKAQNYDLFISEHSNAYNQQTRGVEVFYDFSKPQDKAYAEELALEVSKVMNNPNRGSKTRTYDANGITYNYYGVIRGASATNCPHIFLIESGYHDNLEDEAFLKIDSNLKKIAQAQANVILKILGIEVKEMAFDEAKKIIQDKAGLDNNSMQYLEFYKYGEDLIKKLAVPMVNNVIVKEPIIEQLVVDDSIGYSKSSNNTYQLWGKPKQLGVKVVNKKNNTIEEPYSMNSVFFWWSDIARTQSYPTSILIKDGVILRNEANHLDAFGTPQSVFIVYRDGKVEMKQVKYATELDYKNIIVGVGGVGLKNSTDPNFKYNPALEGFKKDKHLQTGITVDYSDVLRQATKTIVGYNIKQDKVYLMMRPNIFHSHTLYYDLLELVNNCEYDLAVSLDGGNSVYFNNADEMVYVGSGRLINSIIGFNLN